MLEYGIFMAFQPIEISMSLTRLMNAILLGSIFNTVILASTMYRESSFFLAMNMFCVKEAQ